MNFITLTTLNNQTLLITPREAGQILRFGGVDTVSIAETEIRVFGSGTVELSSGWWDNVAVVDGSYAGPYFDGNGPSSELSRYRWESVPNESPSVFETRTVTGTASKLQALQRAAWVGGQGHSGARFSGTPTYVTNSPINGGRIGFAATFTEVGSWVYG